MHRFFVEPDTIAGERAVIRGLLAHQLSHVLRLQTGARVLLLDGDGSQAEAELEQVSGREVHMRILAAVPAIGEPRLRVILFQALLRKPRFEWVLQKGTELGVSAFVPVVSERCVARPSQRDRQHDRWRTIIREAAEQSERGRLPSCSAPVAFAEGCSQASRLGPALLAWEEARESSLRCSIGEVAPRLAASDTPTVSLLVGPEGGFTPAEAAQARTQGIQVVGLGPRILRAETASVAMVAALLYALGEWDAAPPVTHREGRPDTIRDEG